MIRGAPFGAFLFAILFLATPLSAFEIERVVSPGGIEAWLVEEHTVPVIVMEVAWEGGTATDTAEKAGTANMAASLLGEGAGDLPSQAFGARLDDIAAQLSFSVDNDYLNASLKTLAEARDEAFSLFALAIAEPRFDEDAIERIRAQIGVAVARNRQSPDWLAADAWYRAALGGHPYALNRHGTLESVPRITRDDMTGYVKNIMARGNMKIAVVGPISAEELGLLLDRTFGGLPADAVLPDIPAVEVASGAQTLVVERDFPQSVVIFGTQGIARDDPDFIPAFMMNHILGSGSFSSRLMEEVREKRGLAYSVGTSLSPLKKAAMMFGQVATRNERVGQSLAIIRGEIRRMAEEGVSAEELADAKTYLTGSCPLRFTSNSSIANQLIGIQTENLGIDYVNRRNGLIEEVTQEDIARVARRLLRADDLIVAIVGRPNLSPVVEGLPEAGDMLPSAEPARRH